jgi:HEPN domain-containing protein
MSGADAGERRAEADRWLLVADQDIAAARLCLSAAPPLPAVAAYHCQQATEKIAKALLISAGVAVPKTHDLAALSALVGPRYPALAATLGALEVITVWGFAYRYPPEEESSALPDRAEIAKRLHDIEALRQSASAVIAGAG